MIGTSEQRIALSAVSASLETFREFAERCFDGAGVEDPARDCLVSALGEALGGMVRWASDARDRCGDFDYHIAMAIDVSPLRVQVTIDDGWLEGPFVCRTCDDAALVIEADRTRAHEFSMRHLQDAFDEISFAFRRDRQNELVLVKYR